MPPSLSRFLAPLEGVALILWWAVDVIRSDPNWWLFSTESLAMTLSQVSLAHSLPLLMDQVLSSGLQFFW